MHPEPGPGPPTQPGWIWILEKITASLSRRNLIVKLYCPFILLSSRNISESSSSTSISTSIRPSTQPVQRVACGHHLTSHISHLTHPHPPSLTPPPEGLPPLLPSPRAISACRPEGQTGMDTLQASWGFLHRRSLAQSLTLVFCAPATSIASLCGVPAMRRPGQSER